MKGFIKVTDTLGKSCLLNIEHIVLMFEMNGFSRIIMYLNTKPVYVIVVKESIDELTNLLK